MSIEAAQAFMQKARTTEVLQQRIEALSGRGTLEQLVDIGRESGFDFSVEEYRQAVVLESEGELEDAALQALLEEVANEQRQAYEYLDQG